MTVPLLDLVRTAIAPWRWASVAAAGKSVVRYLSLHSGVPAMLVAALLVCLGYRVLKRGFRLAVEVVAVAFALAAASELGWIRW